MDLKVGDKIVFRSAPICDEVFGEHGVVISIDDISIEARILTGEHRGITQCFNTWDNCCTRKVKNTALARKMYPEGTEEGEWLNV